VTAPVVGVGAAPDELELLDVVPELEATTGAAPDELELLDVVPELEATTGVAPDELEVLPDVAAEFEAETNAALATTVEGSLPETMGVASAATVALASLAEPESAPPQPASITVTASNPRSRPKHRPLL
jgi:hypothetical protein